METMSWHRFRQRIAACFTQRTSMQCHLIVLCALRSDRIESPPVQAGGGGTSYFSLGVPPQYHPGRKALRPGFGGGQGVSFCSSHPPPPKDKTVGGVVVFFPW